MFPIHVMHTPSPSLKKKKRKERKKKPNLKKHSKKAKIIKWDTVYGLKAAAKMASKWWVSWQFLVPFTLLSWWILLKIDSEKSRSSQQRCSLRKGVLGSFAKFSGKHLCQSLLFNKVADLFAKFTGKHLCQSLIFNKVAGLSLQLY